MLADELYVIGERQRDDERHDHEQREVDGDREEPLAPDQLGPRAQSRRRAAEQDDREQHDPHHLVERPQPVAARVVPKRLRRRGRHGHGRGFADRRWRGFRGWRGGRL